MKALTIAILALSCLVTSNSFADQNPAIDADKQAINSACSADASTAGCGSEVVGKGLLKCLHMYKKANPSFKFSDGCKAAMKQLHADKSASK